MSEKYDARALFTFPAAKEGAPEHRGLMISGRPSLINDLRNNQGVDAFVVRGNKQIDTDSGTISRLVRPEYTEDGSVSVEHVHDAQLTDFNVLRSTGSPMDTDQYITSLNPMNLRRFARDKSLVGDEILGPLDLYRSHLLIPAGETVAGANDIAIASNLVMKPNGGFASRGIHPGTPVEIAEHLKTASAEPLILEERLRFDMPIPGIKGATEYEQARLDQANQLGVNKELRMYSYGDNQWMPVARIAEPGALELKGDEWVYIDEDSVPAEAHAFADAVKHQVDMKVGTSDTLLAIDLVYATSETRPEPHWEVMELNAEPYTMRPELNGDVGLRHRKALVAQIGRIARNNTEYSR